MTMLDDRAYAPIMSTAELSSAVAKQLEPNPRAVIGGNNPPPDTFPERMKEKYGSVFDSLEPLAELADEQPAALADDAGLSKVGDIIREVRRLFKEIEDIRKKEKDAFLRGGREIDDYFTLRKDAVKRVWDAMQALADDYQDRKKKAEAERLKAAADAAHKEALRLREQAQTEQTAQSAEQANEASARADEMTSKAATSTPADLTRVRTDNGTTSATEKWTYLIEDWSAIDMNVLRPFIPRERVEAAIQSYANFHKEKSAIAGVKFFTKTKAVVR